MALTFPENPSGQILAVLILGFTVERFWVTFCSKRRLKSPPKKPWLTTIPITTYLIIYFMAVIEFLSKGEEGTILTTLSFVGFLLLVIGITLRRAAMRQFGIDWNIHVDAEAINSLVRTGPYRWIRHPYYLSVPFELVGFALTLNAPLSAVSAFCIQAPLLLLRIAHEERELLRKFGLGYLLYCSQAGAIFPRLSSVLQLKTRHA